METTLALPQEIVGYIDECLQQEHADSYLIPVLHKIQNHFGYLAPEHLETVAQRMRIPSARVSGVATFYHLFSFVPRGKYRIALCLGTACYVKGAGKVLERFEELLGIKQGETTPDQKFSLELARCVGACALAPVVIVNEKVYGKVQPDEVVQILSEHGFGKKPNERNYQ